MCEIPAGARRARGPAFPSPPPLGRPALEPSSAPAVRGARGGRGARGLRWPPLCGGRRAPRARPPATWAGPAAFRAPPVMALGPASSRAPQNRRWGGRTMVPEVVSLLPFRLPHPHLQSDGPNPKETISPKSLGRKQIKKAIADVSRGAPTYERDPRHL